MAIDFNSSICFHKSNTTYRTRAITSKNDIAADHYLTFKKDSELYYVPLLTAAVQQTSLLPVKVRAGDTTYNVAVITPTATIQWINISLLGHPRVNVSVTLNMPVASDTECYVRSNLNGGGIAERYVTIAAGETEAIADFSETAISLRFTIIVEGCDEIVIYEPSGSGNTTVTLS